MRSKRWRNAAVPAPSYRCRMQEILEAAADWARAGRAFAVATVIAVAGSAPREIGASMVVSADGDLFGNVSAGCVEGAVYGTSLEVIADGAPVVERFGYSDADAIEIGLTCGGVVEVLVRRILPASAEARELILLAERDAAGIPTRFDLALSGAHLGHGRIVDVDSAPDPTALSVVVGAQPRLIVVGAVEFAVALTRLGVAAGMRVTVVDGRAVFATAARFPGAEVVVDRPGRYLAAQRLVPRDAVCVLSHDPKFDVPALQAALASAAGYVGAMGSRRTHDDRARRLREAGVRDDALARLRSPLGLDLGGRTPAETALSILAEIVADRHGASGMRLTERSGPVHAGTVVS